MTRSTMLAILGRMGELYRPDAHVGRGTGLQAASGPRDLHLGRRAADAARQGRPIPDRHAGRDEVRLTPLSPLPAGEGTAATCPMSPRDTPHGLRYGPLDV